MYLYIIDDNKYPTYLDELARIHQKRNETNENEVCCNLCHFLDYSANGSSIWLNYS